MSREMRAGMAAVFKALGHPTRLMLAEELSKGEKCVCELVPMTGVDFSTVSKHLALLRTAGLIKSRKQDLNVYYSISMPEARRIISLARAGVKSSHSRLLKVAGA
jgi:ArsR family transcriptional regulator